MSVEGAPDCPVYVVFGREPFLRQEALRRLVATAFANADDSPGPAKFPGDVAELADVLDEVRTPSLLGDPRVAVVEDADRFVTRYRDALTKYCDNPSDTGKLILVCNTFDARTRFYKAVTRLRGAVACEPLRGAAVLAWIVDRAARVYAKRVDRGAAARLREYAGDSLGVLDGELNKLSTYVGDRDSITTDDIDLLVGNVREQTVFAITDAMAEGDPRRALHHWERVLATDRAAPGRAIGGLAWGIRQLLGAHDAIAGGAPTYTVARQLRTDASALQRRLRNLPRHTLEDQLCDLLEADVAGKSGRSSVGRAVERFIIRHSASGRPTGTGGPS